MPSKRKLSERRSSGGAVAAFLERFCCHVEGSLFGQSLAVESWQRELLDAMFEVGSDGLRLFRRVTVGIPRGNGKSTLISGLGHFLLSADGENAPQVFSGAAGTDQARVVHNAARSMAEMSPALRRLRVEVQRDKIFCHANRGVWKVVSRLGDLQQGTSPHAALVDEYHVHKSDALYQAFRTGMHKRANPLLACITTAGVYGRGPLWEQYRNAVDSMPVEQVSPYLRVVRDEQARFLMYWWGLDDDDTSTDISDPRVVRGCNPASWLDPVRIVNENLLSGDLREADFRRYYLNQWVKTDGEGIKPAEWDACEGDAEFDADLPVMIGVDIGWSDDWSAVVAVQQVGDEVRVRAALFDPGEAGLDVRATVEREVSALTDKYRVVSIAFDPFASITMMQDWDGWGWPVVEFRQFQKQMCPSSALLLRLVQDGRLVHDGNPLLRDHVLNAVMKDTESAWKFAKPDDKSRKIDGLVALLAALWRLDADDSESVYDTRGPVIL